MEIDRETKLNISIILDNNPAYLKMLKAQADEDGHNEDGNNKLSLTADKHSFQMEEYYFDERDNELIISGLLVSENGESYVYVYIPLSDIVLVDILQYAVKKFNKLKTVFETLKK